MNRSMINASNTMGQLQQQLNLIGNNLANGNTAGYKRREANFSEMLYQQFNNQPGQKLEEGRLTASGIRQGTGAKLAHTNVQLRQGPLKETGRELDVALTGSNLFFKVRANEGGKQAIRYTRDGSFQLAPAEAGRFMLVDSQGNAVMDINEEPIVISGPFKELKFEKSGKLVVLSEDANSAAQAFDLSINEAKRPQFLQDKGNGLFGLPELGQLDLTVQTVIQEIEGEERSALNVRQGALEESTVDLTSEMSELSIVQRAYQFNARSISIADQMMGLINGIRS